MSRFSISLMLVFALGSSVVAEQNADACGVKLAIKAIRKRTNVANSDRPVVAQRQARTPIATGPRAATQPRTPTTTKAPPVRVATATPPPDKPPVTTPPPTPVTPPPAPVPAPPPEKLATTTTTTDKVVEPVQTKTVAKKVPATSATLSDEIYFSVNSVSPKMSTKAVKWLNANPDTHVVVEGFADPTGTPDENMILSRSRAEAVRDVLVKAGVDTSRIEVNAYGDTKLKYGAADGRNRRVTVESKK